MVLRNRMRLIAAGFFLSLAVTGCANNDGKVLTELSFNHIQPYPLYVASYEVFTTPNTDSLKIPDGFVANPVKIANDYFTNRFNSTGSRGKLSVLIDSANIEHKIEQSSNKIGAYMGVDRYDTYDISMIIKMVVFDVSEFEKKESSIRVNRSISISEHETLAEKERLQMDAMDKLMDDVDLGVKNVLAQDFSMLR